MADGSGTSGGIYWERKNGILTISPASSPESGYTSGQMKDYGTTASVCPWITTQTAGYHLLIIKDGVKNLSAYSFHNCTGLVGDIIIPDSVTDIGTDAFYNDNGFRGTLKLPSNLQTIGAYAFGRCINVIGDLTIPDSVTDIGWGAFSACYSLNGTITVGSGVTTLYSGAFTGCNSVSKILIKCPKPTNYYSSDAFKLNTESPVKYYTVESRNRWAQNKSDFPDFDYTKWTYDDWILAGGVEYRMYGTSKRLVIRPAEAPESGYTTGQMKDYTQASPAPWAPLTESGWTLELQSGITNIGDYSFFACYGFTGTLNIPNTVTKIGISSFEGCTGFTGALVIPDSVNNLMGATFEYCTGITSVSFGTGMTYIPATAFMGCTGLKTLTIPDHITSIGSSTFMNCTGLMGTLTIGSGVTSVGANAFYNCPNLDKVVINCPRFSKLPDMFNLSPSAPEKIYKLTSYHKWAMNRTWFPEFTYTKWKDLDWAVSGGIEWYKFDDTKVLALRPTEDMESGYTSGQMKDYTAVGPWGVITDDGWTLDLQSGITNIGKNSFNGCVGLGGDMNIPSSVTSIGDYAFNHCEQLTGDINIPSGVTYIGEYAFRYCELLTGAVEIPEGITAIKEGAFMHCTNLEGPLTIPSTVTTIGDYAFENCPNMITKIELPSGLTSVGMSAFNGCSKAYGSLVFPSTLTTLDTMAFQGCKEIRNVYFDGPEIPIGDSALNLNSDGDPKLYFAYGSWLDETKLPVTGGTVWAFNIRPTIPYYNTADGWKNSEVEINGATWDKHWLYVKINYP